MGDKQVLAVPHPRRGAAVMDMPLHAKFVHLPVALAVLMPLLTGGVLLAIWKQWFGKRVWSLVAAGQFLLVVSGFVALRTGEHDEERVERLVPEVALHLHERAGEAFVWAGAVVLGLVLLAWLLPRPRLFALAGLGSLLGTLVVAAFGYVVGERGGELVYRHQAGSAFAAAPAPTAPAGRDHDHDR